MHDRFWNVPSQKPERYLSLTYHLPPPAEASRPPIARPSLPRLPFAAWKVSKRTGTTGICPTDQCGPKSHEFESHCTTSTSSSQPEPPSRDATGGSALSRLPVRRARDASVSSTAVHVQYVKRPAVPVWCAGEPAGRMVMDSGDSSGAKPIFLAGPRPGVSTTSADRLQRKLRFHNRSATRARPADAWVQSTTALRRRLRQVQNSDDRQLKDLANRALSADVDADLITEALEHPRAEARHELEGLLRLARGLPADGPMFLQERVRQNRAIAEQLANTDSTDADDARRMPLADLPDEVFKDFSQGPAGAGDSNWEEMFGDCRELDDYERVLLEQPATTSPTSTVCTSPSSPGAQSPDTMSCDESAMRRRRRQHELRRRSVTDEGDALYIADMQAALYKRTEAAAALGQIAPPKMGRRRIRSDGRSSLRLPEGRPQRTAAVVRRSRSADDV